MTVLREDEVLEDHQIPSFEHYGNSGASQRPSTLVQRVPQKAVKRLGPTKKPVHPIVVMDVEEEDYKGQEESDDSLLIDSDGYSETPKPLRSGKWARAVVVVLQRPVLTKAGVQSEASSSKRSRDSRKELPVKQKRIEVTPSESKAYEDSNNEEEWEKELDLFRETLEEKVRAFGRRKEIVSLKGAEFQAKTRVTLALVPGLLSKVSLVCLLQF